MYSEKFRKLEIKKAKATIETCYIWIEYWQASKKAFAGNEVYEKHFDELIESKLKEIQENKEFIEKLENRQDYESPVGIEK